MRAPVAWLGPDYIMASLIVTSVWQFFPFVVVTYLARLQTIPPELYEAAHGRRRRRRGGASCTSPCPQTASVLFVIVLLRSIWMFTKFDTVWLMAGDGGVSRYIRTLPVYAYARSFTYLQAGMGAALAVIMFAMLLVATAVYFRMFRERGGVLVRRGGSASTRPARVLFIGAAFPFLWMLSTALKPSGEIFATPRLVPLLPPSRTSARLFADTSFLVFFRNSVAGGRRHRAADAHRVSASAPTASRATAFAGATAWPA